MICSKLAASLMASFESDALAFDLISQTPLSLFGGSMQRLFESSDLIEDLAYSVTHNDIPSYVAHIQLCLH